MVDPHSNRLLQASRRIATAVAFGTSLAMLFSTCNLFKVGLGSQIDITPPSVSISSPAQGSIISGTVTLRGAATDDTALDGVTLSLGGTALPASSLSLATDGSWSLPFDTASLPDGRYDLQAYAKDASGKSADAVARITIDNSPPAIYLDGPVSTGTERLNGTVLVSGRIADDWGVRSLVVALRVGSVEHEILSLDSSTSTQPELASWSAELNLDDALYAIPPSGDQELELLVTVIDAAGNPALADPAGNPLPKVQTLYVNRNGDEPAIDFLTLALDRSIEFPRDMGVAGNSFSPLMPLTASLSDDDGLDLDSFAIETYEAGAGGPRLLETYTRSSPEIELVYQAPDAGRPLLQANVTFTIPDLQGEFGMIIRLSDDASFKFGKPAAETVISAGGNPLSIVVDQGSPDFAIDTPANGSIVSDLHFEGTASDGWGVGRIALSLEDKDGVKTSYDSSALPQPFLLESPAGTPASLPVDQLAWSFTPASPAPEGRYKILAQAWDRAGDPSLPVSLTLVVDRTGPEVAIQRAAPLTASGKSNGILVVYGSSLDRQNSEIVAGEWTSDAWASVHPITGDLYSWSFTLDTTTLAAGPATIAVRFTDAGGNRSVDSSLAIDVDQTTDLPTLALTNLDTAVVTSAGVSATVNLLESNPKLSGSIADDEMLDLASAEIRIDAVNGAAVSLGAWQDLFPGVTTNALERSFNFDLNGQDPAEGVKRVYVRVMDLGSAKRGKAAVSTVIGPVYFAIDKASPALAILSPGVGSLQRADFSLSGTASDANGILGSKVVVTVWDSGALVGEPAVGADGSWSLPVSVAALDGYQRWKIRTTDNFGKSTESPFIFTVDKTPPAVAISAPPAAAWLADLSYTATGSAADVDIGGTVVSVEYSLASATGPWDLARLGLGNSWSLTLPLAALPESAQTLWLRATDAAGNVSATMSRSFTPDRTKPLSTIGGSGGVFAATSAASASASAALRFTLSGTATDAVSGPARILVTETVNGLTSEVLDSDKTGGLSGASAAWASPQLPLAGLVDGSYEYSITLTDRAGNVSQYSRSVSIDLTAPDVNAISAPAPGQTGLNALSGAAFTFRGSAADASGGVGLAKVWCAITKSATAPAILTTPEAAGYEAVATSGNWNLTKSLPGDLAQDLGYYLHVLAEDSSGNRTPTASAASVGFDVDLANPSLGNPTLVTPALADQVLGDTAIVNRQVAFSLSGNAADSHGVGSVSITQNKDGSGAVPIDVAPALLGGTAQARTWSLSGLPRVPGNIGATATANGVYEYVVTVTDLAGKQTSLSRTVRFDNVGPTLTVTGPSEGSWSSSANVTVSGIASDLTGVKAIYYMVGAAEAALPADLSTDASWTAAGWSKAGGTTSSWNLALAGLGEGNQTVWIRSIDTVLNLSGSHAHAFGVDLNLPELGAATPLANVNAGFGLGCTASDSNPLGLATLTVTQRKGAGAALNITANGPSSLDAWANWTLANLPRDPASPGLGTQVAMSPASDGVYEYLITATDAAGKTRQLTRTVRFDRTAPDSLAVLTDLASWQRATSLVVQGTASDTAGASPSEIKQVQYKLGAAPWAPLNGTQAWSGTVALLENKTNSLQFRAEDNAGNELLSAVYTVKVDKTPPALAVTGWTAFLQTRTDLGFAGTVSDNNVSLDALAPLVVQLRKGSSFSELPIVPTGVSWSWTLPVEGAGAVEDGLWEISFIAKDESGLTSTISTTVQVDTAPPTLAISAPADGESTGSQTYTVYGTARDPGGVGFDGFQSGSYLDVAYKLDGAAAWTEIQLPSGSLDWSIPNLDLGAAEGGHTLRFTSTDLLGNASAEEVRTLYYDKTPPELSELGIGAGSQKRNDEFTLWGYASDSNGLKTRLVLGVPTPYVTVSIDSGEPIMVDVDLDGPNNILGDLDDGYWSYNHVPTGDGDVSFTITATDKANKSKSVARLVTVDTAPPSITDVSIFAGIVDRGADDVVNGIVSIRFTASDALAGVERSGGNYQAWFTVLPDNPADLSGGFSAADIAGWTPITSAASVFTFDYDTGAVILGQRDLYIGLRDAVTGSPNRFVRKLDLAIDQESDRPDISFDNLDAGALANSDNGFGNNPSLLLTLADDDGLAIPADHLLNPDTVIQYRIDADNDGDFADFAGLVTAGTAWEDERVWHPVEQVGASGKLVQAKIKLTGFPQGAFQVQVRVRDTNSSTWTGVYGQALDRSWRQSAIIPFAVDYGPPTIYVSSPSSGTYKDDFTVGGTATDALAVISVDYSLDGGSSRVNLFTGNSLSAAFSGTVDVDLLPTGEYILQVEATDFGGTTATQQVPIVIDRTKPTVSVLQPGAGDTLNGASVTVRGEATDNRQLGAVFFWHGAVGASDPALPGLGTVPVGATTMVAGSRYKIVSLGDTVFTDHGAPSNGIGVSFTATGPGGGSGTVYAYSAGGYSLATGSSVWSGSIDTTATVLSAANGYRIRTVAVDAIGNVGTPADLLLTVDQEKDRPVVSFSNLSLTTPTKLPASVNVAFYGNVNDDDLTDAASVQIRIDRNGDGDFEDGGEAWGTVSMPPSANAGMVSWSHEASLTNEGKHYVQVRARHFGAPAYPGTAAEFDAAYGATFGWVRSAPVEFYIDNGPPALDVTLPSTPGQKFTVDGIDFTGTTQDSTGIKRVVVWVDKANIGVIDPGEQTVVGMALDGLSGSALTTDNTLYGFSIPVAGIPDGSITVRITAYDASGSTTFRDLSVVVDTTNPTATITEPAAASSTQNGSMLVRGTAYDAIQVSKVYWNLRKQSEAAPTLISEYSLIPDKTYSWEFTLDTTGYADTVLPADPYVLRIVVEDGVGRTNLASPATKLITIDQDADKPVIDVLTLADDMPLGSTMGSAVQNILPASRVVSGTVKDDDLVDKAKVQIRVDYDNDGIFGETVSEATLDRDLNGDTDKLDSFVEAWGDVSVPPELDSPLAAWSHFFGLTDGRYRFQVRAADVYDDNPGPNWLPGAFSWSESSVIPFSIDLNSPTGSIIAPANASFLRGVAGSIAVTGNAADASGIKRVTIAYDRGSDYRKQDGSPGEDELYFQADPDLYPLSYSWSDSYAVSHGDDQVFFRVTITDAFDKTRTYERYFTVDTTPPTTDFILPASGQAVNGAVFSRGTANDANRVDSLWFKPTTAAGPSSVGFDWATDSAANLAADGWRMVGSYTWEAYFKSTLLSADYVNDVGATIHLMAIDAAGNRSDPTDAAPAQGRNRLPIVIRQKDNLPVVTVTTGENSILDNSGMIRGRVEDAQGVDKDSLEISFDDGLTWRPVSSPPAANSVYVEWSHLVSEGLPAISQRAAAYPVKVRAKDIGQDVAGTDYDIGALYGGSATVNIRKDDSDPTLTVDSLYNGIATVNSLQGAYVNKMVGIRGTSDDGVGVQKVEAKLTGIDGDYVLVTPDLPGDYSSWSKTWAALSLAGQSQTLEVKVTDVNGRVTAQSFTLLVDTVRPTISFESVAQNPATDSALYGANRYAYNGTVGFAGNAADTGSQVSKVYYRFSATAPEEPTPARLLADWTEANGLYRWTTDNLVTAGAANSLWVVAVDAAGNLSDAIPGTPAVVDPYELAFSVSQDSDKPIVTASAPTASQVLGENAKLLGAVLDDDGIAAIDYQLDLDNDGVFGETVTEAGLGRDLNGDNDLLDSFTESWTAVASPASPGGAKSLNFEQSVSGWTDGYYRVKFRVRDSLYASTLAAQNETETAAIAFSVDTAAPRLELLRITVQDLYGGADWYTESAFNGSKISNDFTLRFTARDSNGLVLLDHDLDDANDDGKTDASGDTLPATPKVPCIEVSTDNLNWLAIESSGGDLFNAALLKGSFTDGTRLVYFRARDVNGKATTGILTILVDKTAPEVSFTSPSGVTLNPASEAPNVNGQAVTVMGSISDASQISSLSIQAGTASLELLSGHLADGSSLISPASVPAWMADGRSVMFDAWSAPAPFVAGKAYYLRDVTAGGFRLAETIGGTAIVVTAKGAGPYAIVRRFVNAGTAPLSLPASPAFTNGAAEILPSSMPSWLANGLAVRFVGAAAPAPFTPGVLYYVRDLDADSFSLAASQGGSAVTVTDRGSQAYLLARAYENEDSKTNWAFTFDSTLFDDADNATLVGSVWRLAIKVQARDDAGNRVTSTGYIDLDPDGDRPIVTIATPGANASVTGLITLTGTVSDDDGTTGSVDIGLDRDGDLDYDDQHADDGAFTGIAVVNGAWSKQINTTAAVALQGSIRVRVTPKDSNGLSGDPMIREFFVDSSLPNIVGYDGSAEIPAPTPATGTRQKGRIDFRALAKDDDALLQGASLGGGKYEYPGVKVSLDGGSNYYKVTDPLINGTVTKIGDLGGKKRYDIAFSVDSALYAFQGDSTVGNGTMSVIFSVTDNTYKPAILSLVYTVDNRPPEAFFDPNGVVSQAGGKYAFSGSGSLNTNRAIGRMADGGQGSGVAWLDLYFIKGGGTLYDPLDGDSTTSFSTAVPAYTQLAFDAGDLASGDIVDPAADTLTLDRSQAATLTLLNDMPIRFIAPAGSTLPGALDATKLYYAGSASSPFSVYTNPARLPAQRVDLSFGSGTVYIEYAVTGFPFVDDVYTKANKLSTHYAIRIDKETELGAYDAVVGVGDEDGFLESFKFDAGAYEWYAHFDTTKLPDGPIDLYYVAYDTTGNRTLGKVAAQIQNEPPSVTMVDVDGARNVTLLPTVNPALDLFSTAADHGLSAGDEVYFSAAILPGNVEADKPYLVDFTGIALGDQARNFKIKSIGGVSVNVSSAGFNVRVSESRDPWLFGHSMAANVPFAFAAEDPGSVAVKNQWSLQLIDRFGNSSDGPATDENHFPAPVDMGSLTSASPYYGASIDVDLDGASFDAGYWYLFRVTMKDEDDIQASRDFYLRALGADLSGPTVTVDDITQDSLVDGHVEDARKLDFLASATTIDIANDRFTLTTGAVATGDAVAFLPLAGGALPGGGLAAGTTYYVIDKNPGYFQVSASRGGAPIPLDNVGSGLLRLFRLGALSGEILLTGTVKDDRYTFPGTPASGDIKVQISSNGTNWYDIGNATRGNVISGDPVLGYEYAWSLAWNTATMNGSPSTAYTVAGTGLRIRAVADDGPTTTTNDTDLRFDVVPYIDKVMIGAKDAERTKLGRYPLPEDTSAAGDLAQATVILRGYNFSGTTGLTDLVRVFNSANAQPVQLRVITAPPADRKSLTFVVDNTASQVDTPVVPSGYLVVTTGTVPSINHTNDDSLPQNREAVANQGWTDDWTDTRYIQTWTAGQYFRRADGTRENPTSVAMALNPNNNELVGAWGHSSTVSLYFMETGATPTYSGNYYDALANDYDPAAYIDLAVRANGTKHITWLDQSQYGAYWSGLRTAEGTTAGTQAAVEATGNAAAEDHSDGLDEYFGQFQNGRISLFAIGATTYNFLTYYDAWAHSLKFGITTNGTATRVTTQATAPAVLSKNTLIDGNDFNTPATGSPAYTQDVGSWSSSAVDGTGEAANTLYPVVMYYDADNQKLMLARSQVDINPIPAAGTAITWQKQEVITDTASPYYTGTGQYVNMVMDTNGDIHAVCYNSENGVLLYLHAANKNGAGAAGNLYTFDAPVVVDSTTGVGVYPDLSLVGTTPHISYIYAAMANTNKGLKYAYLDGVNWEYGTVPCIQPVNSARTGIAAVSVTTTAPSWGRTNIAQSSAVNVAIGYEGQKFYYMVLRPER